MISRLFVTLLGGLLVILIGSPTAMSANQVSDTTLTLSSALDLAEQFDPWLKGNKYSQNEIEALAVSAGELPDPKMSLGLANMGADNFDFGQEPMTQLKVGVSQMFPRGSTRSLSRERLNTLAEQYPHQRQNRKAELAVRVSQIWLSAYQAQESIRLINKDRSLFEYLVDVAEASYATASGKSRQQDFIRAQLELTRLDDRLTALHQNKEQSIKQLKQYISDYLNDQYTEFKPDFDKQEISINQDLPHIKLIEQSFFNESDGIDKNRLYKIFSEHPAVKALQQRIMAEQVGVELARQKYKPAWGVNAGYGYRADADNGMGRADLLSVGITFDLPLFTKNRQDQELKAAISSSEAIETQKGLLLRKMISSFESEKAQLNHLQQRQTIYNNQLLPQINEQAEASLTAYTNDDGDFAEVVRARIAELNAQIDALKINVDIQKAKINLNYLFMTHPSQIAATETEQNP